MFSQDSGQIVFTCHRQTQRANRIDNDTIYPLALCRFSTLCDPEKSSGLFSIIIRWPFVYDFIINNYITAHIIIKALTFKRFE